MRCDICGCEFEYDEGRTYDCDTFVCYECTEELETQTTNWEMKQS